MKKETWDSRMLIIKPWIDDFLSPNDAKNAVLLSITLGDSAKTDELRGKYWSAIRDIGSIMEGFPEQFKQKSRGPTAGTVLRMEFREKLREVSSKVKDSGQVITSDGSPSLENLRVDAEFCDNDVGVEKEKRVRAICAEYNLTQENVNIHLKDCSPKRLKGRKSRYDGGRSGAYNGGNRWPL